MACLGANGRSSFCGSPLNARHISIIFSLLGFFFPNSMLNIAEWPSEIGTRTHVAEISIVFFGTILPPLISPHILYGSNKIWGDIKGGKIVPKKTIEISAFDIAPYLVRLEQD